MSKTTKQLSDLSFDVRLSLLKNSSNRVRAIGSITINGSFVINKITVVESKENNMFMSFYEVKNKAGKYEPVFHPISKEARIKMQEAVLEKYDEKLAEG